MIKFQKLIFLALIVLSFSSRLLEGEEEKKPDAAPPVEGEAPPADGTAPAENSASPTENSAPPAEKDVHPDEKAAAPTEGAAAPAQDKKEKEKKGEKAEDKNTEPKHKIRNYILIALAVLVIGGTCTAFILGKKQE